MSTATAVQPLPSVADLNQRYGLEGQLSFSAGDDGLLVAEINNRHARARVALAGAQLLEYQPHGQPPVVWLSPAARYVPGKSLRGGVPVCWPWFGAHPADKSLPAHGFARNHPWQVVNAAAGADGDTMLTLRLNWSAVPPAWWPTPVELELELRVGARLDMALVTRNSGAGMLSISQALHTYFHVSDVRRIRIQGLDGREYLDKAAGGRGRQSGPVTIDGEVDRIYIGTPDDCLIQDPGLARAIRVAKRHSATTVVWNPGAAKGAAFGDMGPDGYLNMVCVEVVNAADDVVTLAAGASCRMETTVSIEPWGG